MEDQGRKRPRRGRAEARFDEITLAAFVALTIVTVSAMFTIGVSNAGHRIGCGLDDLVDALLAHPTARR